MRQSTARFAPGQRHPAMPVLIFTLALALVGCSSTPPAATPATAPPTQAATAEVTVAAPAASEDHAARAAANPAAFRAALDAYHNHDPDAFRAECTAVMRQVLWAIAELDAADYPPGVRTRLVRERTLARLSATSNSWQGATAEHLKAFEAACDAHLPAAMPIGPGDAG